jgi:pyruvate/2-oxoglutarate dehydrogenase complex dihydrolipoamide acyltransferase (E2) component
MDVLMPQLGETVAEGKISKWFVAAGDAVKPGDNLFEIETDKVSMEVPAIAAGTLAEIRVGAGEVAPVGAVVAVIQGAGEKAPTSPPLIPAQAGIQKSKELGPRWSLPSGGPQARPVGGDERMGQVVAIKPTIQMEPFREVRSPERNYGPARLAGGAVTTPLARRLAGEAGIDLANVKGSGPHGRIVARDVETARSAATPALAQSRAIATIVLTADVGIGQSLALCADVPTIELTDIIVKAWAMALARVTPSYQSGIAIAIGKSRLAIRDVASKSLTAIAKARRDPAAADTPGASSAISIPGVPGITSLVDVLQPPQTTMLSIGAARRAPVEAADGSVRFESTMTVTLSCDSRAVDAALGAELLGAFKGFVEKTVTMIV